MLCYTKSVAPRGRVLNLNAYSMFASYYVPPFLAQILWLLPFLIVWSLTWKGLALWRAARLKQVGWFIALLLINTLGILEIVYLYMFSERPKKNSQPVPPATQP